MEIAPEEQEVTEKNLVSWNQGEKCVPRKQQ